MPSRKGVRNHLYSTDAYQCLVDEKAGNFKKSIFDIRVLLMCTLLVLLVAPWVLDTGSVANIGNSKQKLWNKRRLAKGEVTMCVGSVSKVDVITIAHSRYLRD